MDADDYRDLARWIVESGARMKVSANTDGLLERAVEAAIVTLRSPNADAAGVATALEVRLVRHQNRSGSGCACGHAKTLHEDAALAPECLDLRCTCLHFRPIPPTEVER